ncbi:MAG: IS110 family transposase [Clostridium sp.]
MNNNIIKLNKSRIFIGIDLSKNFHVAKAIDINGELVGTLSHLDNNYEAFEGFKTWVKDLKSKCKVDSAIIGMEPTGIYWQDITSFICTQMPECEAVFIKPHKVKLTRNLYGNGKGKNDFIDALAIARCVKDNNYFYINTQSKEFNNLKAYSRHRSDYLKRENYLYNKLENIISSVFIDYKKVFKEWSSESFVTILSKYPLPEDIVAATEEELLVQLRTKVTSGVGLKKIRLLQSVAKSYLESNTDNLYMADREVVKFILLDFLEEFIVINDKINKIDKKLEELTLAVEYTENLQGIKGMGIGTIAAIFAEAGDIRRFETGKHLISYVGFDLKECSSGNHKGKMKISKCGSSKLRSILFKVALPLVGYNDYFKIYYNYLISRDKNPLKKMQALIAVCCKLLKCIHGMVKNNQKFNGLEVIKGINMELAA